MEKEGLFSLKFQVCHTHLHQVAGRGKGMGVCVESFYWARPRSGAHTFCFYFIGCNSETNYRVWDMYSSYVS